MDQYKSYRLFYDHLLEGCFWHRVFFYILVLSLPSTAFSQVDSGYIKIKTDLQPLLITVDDTTNKVWFIKSDDSLKLKSGKQEIKIINPFIADIKMVYTIKKDTTIVTYISASEKYPYHPKSSYERILARIGNYNTKIVTDSGVDIFLGDSLIGQGMVNLTLDKGSNKFNLKYNNFDIKSITVNSDKDTFAIVYSFLKQDKALAFRLAIIPGASQFYKGQSIKGASFTLLTTAGLLTTYLLNKKFKESKEKFDAATRDYYSTYDPYAAFNLGNQLQSMADETQLRKSRRNAALYITTGVYLLNLLDALLSDPPYGYRDETWHILSQGGISPIRDVNFTFSYSF